MTRDSVRKLRWRFWTWTAMACLALAVPTLWITGVLRPPRPLFHSKYATPFNSDRLPHWVPSAPVVDDAGNMCFFDLPMNLVLLHLASEQSEEHVTRPATTAAHRGKEWIDVPFYGRVLMPKSPRDLLVVTRDSKVVALVSLQQGDAAVVKAWWIPNETRADAVGALIDDKRIPLPIRTALDEFR